MVFLSLDCDRHDRRFVSISQSFVSTTQRNGLPFDYMRDWVMPTANPTRTRKHTGKIIINIIETSGHALNWIKIVMIRSETKNNNNKNRLPSSMCVCVWCGCLASNFVDSSTRSDRTWISFCLPFRHSSHSFSEWSIHSTSFIQMIVLSNTKQQKQNKKTKSKLTNIFIFFSFCLRLRQHLGGFVISTTIIMWMCRS